MTWQMLAAILAQISYKDWDFRWGTRGDSFYIQVRFCAKDNFQGDEASWSGRKWDVSSHATSAEVVQTCLKAVLTAEEHEAREKFLFNGRPIFQPHMDINLLWTIADKKVLRG